MQLFENDSDRLSADTGNLLADLGLDAGSIREALADDRARSCPFPSSAPQEGWREAGGRGEWSGAGEGDRSGFRAFATQRNQPDTGEIPWLLV